MSTSNRLIRVSLGVVLVAALALPAILRLRRRPSRREIAPSSVAVALSALEASTESHCARHRVQPRSPEASGGFVDVTDELGLEFRQAVGPVGSYFMPEINGGGAAFLDYDGDGDLDIFLVNSRRSPRAVGEFPPGTTLGNRLFRQDAGGRLVDVTEHAGLLGSGYGIGCAAGDVNNDGSIDLYVSHYGGDQLYLNRGQGTFENVSSVAGIDDREWSTSVAFFDYDRDGWLDIVVANYVEDPVYHHSVACGFEGRFSYCGPQEFRASFTRLYHNDGPQSEAHALVHFTDVTGASGLRDSPTAGLGLVCADFDADGWPDVYVASDMLPNRLWMNQRNGTFRDEAATRGVSVNSNGIPEGSMGLALGDFDNDGDDDLVVTNLVGEGTAVYENAGEGLFRDARDVRGVLGATRDHTGWGVGLVDFDHDGSLDLAIGNGLVIPCRLGLPPHGAAPFVVPLAEHLDPQGFWRDFEDANVLLVNDGTGRFADGAAQGGDFCSAVGSARALVYGDIDNDGDVDLLVTNCGGAARLYRNDIAKRGHWLMVRAVDPRLRRDGYGANVAVLSQGRWLRRTINPASSYLASNDPRAHFGLGSGDEFDKIVVDWQDGLREAFAGGPADRFLVLERGTGDAVPQGSAP